MMRWVVIVVTVIGAGFPGMASTRLASRTLTPDGADRYVATATAAGLVGFSAPSSNTGSNLRRVYWPVRQAERVDGAVCASWVRWSVGSVQPGLAVRVTDQRAITVTRNVWAGAYWVLNVHTWQGPVFTQVGQIDLSGLVLVPGGVTGSGYRPLPWRVCVAVRGSLLSTKVWFPAEEVEPPWSDMTRVWLTQLPDGWVHGGRFGWYVGHLPAGGSLTMSGLVVGT